VSKLTSRFRVPSYRRHKPSKQAVVTLYGKDFYLGRYGTKESRELTVGILSTTPCLTLS
jgi:hypothetical protein